MDRKHIVAIAALATLVAGLAAGSAALAQTSTGYNLEWHVIGGGGQPASSAHYVLHSTAGQGAASPAYSVSAHYAVSGGYWFKHANTSYLPLILRKF